MNRNFYSSICIQLFFWSVVNAFEHILSQKVELLQEFNQWNGVLLRSCCPNSLLVLLIESSEYRYVFIVPFLCRKRLATHWEVFVGHSMSVLILHWLEWIAFKLFALKVWLCLVAVQMFAFCLVVVGVELIVQPLRRECILGLSLKSCTGTSPRSTSFLPTSSQFALVAVCRNFLRLMQILALACLQSRSYPALRSTSRIFVLLLKLALIWRTVLLMNRSWVSLNSRVSLSIIHRFELITIFSWIIPWILIFGQLTWLK